LYAKIPILEFQKGSLFYLKAWAPDIELNVKKWRHLRQPQETEFHSNTNTPFFCPDSECSESKDILEALDFKKISIWGCIHTPNFFGEAKSWIGDAPAARQKLEVQVNTITIRVYIRTQKRKN
jgi:hypothetical protein